MSAIDRLYAWNRTRGADAAAPGVAARPAQKVAILTCMDVRIDLAKMLGIGVGDAHVLRNAGGIVTDDVIRSLTVSQVALGTTETMIVQHTRCGMEGLVDRDFKEEMQRLRGRRPTFELGGFADVRQRVRDSVRELRRNSYLAGTVEGFVFDVDRGLLEAVEVP